jgi:NTP pyrophosphatase (non-canonical NTP hydrolase)
MSGMKNNFAQLMLTVKEEIFLERCRQNEKWGIQRHDMGRWLAILVEEVGEFAQAMQEDTVSHKTTDANNKLKEIIQVAAVAAAIAEQLLEEQETQHKKPGYADLDD